MLGGVWGPTAPCSYVENIPHTGPPTPVHRTADQRVLLPARLRLEDEAACDPRTGVVRHSTVVWLRVLCLGVRMLVLCLMLVTLYAVQAQRKQQSLEWDHRSEAQKVNARGCANLTLVLDNWKYAIMTQVKDLLLHDHNTVLPDYGRIGPLSDALGDLYKEFNALKERLGDLTVKFDDVEAFVDDVRAGRSPTPPRREPRPPAGKPVEENATNTEERRRPPGRRTRVVIRRIKKPAGS
ncbi:unnamed protein product [Boreogadus saida]